MTFENEIVRSNYHALPTELQVTLGDLDFALKQQTPPRFVHCIEVSDAGAITVCISDKHTVPVRAEL